MERTWTLLSQTSEAGSTILTLKHNATAMGWQVGDDIGIATTTRSDSPRHTIVAINGVTLTLDRPLQFTHWGGIRTIEGYALEMAAEVINLQRSVLITGDDLGRRYHDTIHILFTHTIFTTHVITLYVKNLQIHRHHSTCKVFIPERLMRMNQMTAFMI